MQKGHCSTQQQKGKQTDTKTRRCFLLRAKCDVLCYHFAKDKLPTDHVGNTLSVKCHVSMCFSFVSSLLRTNVCVSCLYGTSPRVLYLSHHSRSFYGDPVTKVSVRVSVQKGTELHYRQARAQHATEDN